MVRIVPTIITLLLLCVPALCDTMTVSQTLTYKDNNEIDPNGPFFIPPNEILDHGYHRGAWEDWGWTHDMSSLEPTGATAVASATLKVRFWDVADVTIDDILCPEEDRIYAIRTSGGTQVSFRNSEGTTKLPATQLGELGQTGQYEFGSTVFTLPGEVLDDLWTNHGMTFFMNIDGLMSELHGHRVTVIYSLLTVAYEVPDASWEPNLPVYRFMSKADSSVHFYTTKEGEKNKLINNQPDRWAYEGIAYYTYPCKISDDLSPVYRFWSASAGCHFFTIKEGEKDKLMAYCSRNQALEYGLPSTWTYEGIAFYAHPVPAAGEDPPVGSSPIYRFMSNMDSGKHFFTIKEGEKNKLINYQSVAWFYEGIGWYGYTE
jgi:hypothetical protein